MNTKFKKEQDENCPFAKIQLVRVNLAVTYKQIMLGWLHADTSKIQVNFKRISIKASEHRDAYISPPICFNQLNFGLHLVLFKIYTSLHTTLSRRIQKIMIGVVGTLDHYIDTFYFPENSIKIIQNFKEKRGGCAPLGPPLDLPLIVIVQGHVLGSRIKFFFPPRST